MSGDDTPGIDGGELDRLFALSPDLMAILDPEGRVRRCNPAFEMALGFSQHELQSQPLLDLFHPDDHPEARTALERLPQARRAELLSRVRRRDGSYRWVQLRLAADDQRTVFVVGRDATDHQEALLTLRAGEKHLSDELKRYRLLAESIDDIFWTADFQMHFTYLSPAITRIRGYEIAEAMQQSLEEVLCPGSLQLALDALAVELPLAAAPGGDPNRRVTLELEEYCKDGSSIWTETTLALLRDDDKQPIGIAGVTRDISERKRAEAALSENEQRFRLVAEQTGQMIYDLDLATEKVTWAGAIEEITGFTAEEFRDVDLKRWEELIHPEDRRATVQALDRCIRANVPFLVGYRLGRRGGGHVMVEDCGAILRDEKGAPSRMVGRMKDISEVLRAEQARLESQRRLAQIIDFLPFGTIVIDSDGAILAWNRAMEQMTGYLSSQMLGKKDHEYSVPIYRERCPMLIDTALGADLGPRSANYQNFYRDGDAFYAESIGVRLKGAEVTLSLAASALRDGDGRVIGAIELIRDITGPKRVEEEKRELEAQFRQSQKMESVGRLAGGVAHDFNNLLTAITGNLEMALMDLSPKDPLAESLRESLTAAESAASLTRQLLAFSRKQIIAPKVLDLNVVVAHLSKMLQRLLGEDVELSLLLDPQPGKIRADAGQLEQVLVNLAVNSRDAMPEGGKLTIETANVILDQAYCQRHVEARPGEYVMLAVIDTGLGMDDEVKSHLFEPFFTTKPVGEGTGLGLDISWRIVVNKHHGDLQVESQPGQTVFRVRLPLQAPARPLTERSDEQSEEPG
jgi:PAS domain S-box-containing protein